jgi:acid phosphatase type 7
MRATYDWDRRQFLLLLAGLSTSSRGAAQALEDRGFRRMPSLHAVTTEAAVLVWTLNQRIPCVVEVSQPDDAAPLVYPASVEEVPASETGLERTIYLYRANLRGLAPDALYLYRVRAEDAPPLMQGPLRFRTAPANHSVTASPFRFLHFADSGDGGENQVRLAWEMQKEKDVAFVLANGDLAYDLSTHLSIDEHYYGVYRDLMARIPFFASLGNHEYYTSAARPALRSRVSPRVEGIPAVDEGRYYSFDWSNAHFVALDSNTPLEDAAAGRGTMLRWLEDDLKRTRKFWRIVFFHHPGYATGKHQEEPEAARVREHIVPILERYGVQLVFHGHEHNYQRTHELLGGEVVPTGSGGIVYVTAGGGGAGTYWPEPSSRNAVASGLHHYLRVDVDGPKLVVRARAPHAESDLDSFAVSPPPALLGSVMGGGGASPNLASGGLAWVTGRNLAPGSPIPNRTSTEQEALTAQLSAQVGDQAARIVSADSGQLCLQIPWEFVGDGTLEVRTANGSAKLPISVKSVAPSLLPNPGDLTFAWARHEDGAPVDSWRPAYPSEALTLLVTGLGPVEPETKAVLTSVQVRVGRTAIEATKATLSATAPGVYEVQFTMPEAPDAAGGPVSLQVTADGVSSNRLLLR